LSIEDGGIGRLGLAADIWAIINILQSHASAAAKVVWTVVVLFFPVLGFIVWLFAGPRSGR
jgi:hypothetical protein